MKVKQIASILNTVFAEALGDEAFAEDLGNIVSAGQTITSATTFGDNFDNYCRSIIDKVGKTVFVDRTYTAQDLGLWRESFEFGCILEKLRVAVGENEDNGEWMLPDDSGNGESDYNDALSTRIEKLFKFYPAKVRAKYFSRKTTFRVSISIAEKQLRGAFRSSADMARFIGMIENAIRTKLEIEKDQLQRRVLANLIAHKIATGKNLVDMSTDYASETGETAPASLAVALHTPNFLRYAAMKITLDKELMTAPSNIYSDLSGDFYNHTPESESNAIFISDFGKALAFNLYSGTFNEKFVQLDNFRKLPFWQAHGTNAELETRSSLKVITTDGETVNRTGVLGIVMDNTAAMICNYEPEVTSQWNADGRFYNYFYNVDCSYYTDFDENAIVYVYGSGETGLRATFAKGTNAGDTVATVSGNAAGTTLLYKVSDDPVDVQQGDALAAGTDGWATLTSGSTQITTTNAKFTYIASVKSGACVQLVVYHVPADKIK